MQENITKFERKVGEGCVHDRIRVLSMDQLRNLDPGDEPSRLLRGQEETYGQETESNLVKRRKGTA